MFARARIDVDGVAREPDEKLRFRMHFGRRASGGGRGKLFFLEAAQLRDYLQGCLSPIWSPRCPGSI
jgi:hypothetical protein